MLNQHGPQEDAADAAAFPPHQRCISHTQIKVPAIVYRSEKMLMLLMMQQQILATCSIFYTLKTNSLSPSLTKKLSQSI